MNDFSSNELKRLGKIDGVRVVEPYSKKKELFTYKSLKEVLLFDGITLEEYLKRLESKIEAQNEEIKSLKVIIRDLAKTTNNNQKLTNSAIQEIINEIGKGRFL